jgi:putative ABC transport system substrate-binding protein
MRRREFIAGLGGALALPLAARAQPTQPVVGFLSSGAIHGYRNLVISLRNGLADQGYVEGRNLTIEYRWAEGHFDRLQEFAADLVARHPTAIIATGIGSALAVQKASKSVPLVFLAGDDPVKFGLVQSLSRPGGTATGVAWLTSELFTKRLELLRDLVPAPGLMGVLTNPTSPELQPQLQEIEAAAAKIGQQIAVVGASKESDLDAAFATLAEKRASTLIVSNDAYFNTVREMIVTGATRHRIATIYDRREWITAGGLISYGTSYTAAYRGLGNYCAKILKGANPAEMPVERPTKFELVVNLHAARSIGLNVSEAFLFRADEVIE